MNHVKLVYQSGSNCSQRALWALRYKNVPHEILMKDKTTREELLKVSPLGKVPAVWVDGIPLAESMAICEWLEETVPSPALLPKDPFARAKVREVCEIVNGTIHPVQSASVARFFDAGATDDQIVSLRRKWIEKTLPAVEKVCFQESAYAVGKSFSLADIFVLPIFAKLFGFGSTGREFPKFLAHAKELRQNAAAWKACPEELTRSIEKSAI